MFNVISRFVWRSAVWLWLRTSEDSWRRRVVANDSPHVHAPGSDPDRLLIAGDGASAGVGVRTHDLGLPGYLARSMTLLTGRATDVDILVTTTMTTTGCHDAVSALELSRFDVILLSLGFNEALGFAGLGRWGEAMTRLLDYIERSASEATKTIVLSVPYLRSDSRFPRILRRAVNRHARELNDLTATLVSPRATVTFLAFAPGEGTEPDGAHSYSQWATHLAPAISKQLEPRNSSSKRSEIVEELARQSSLDVLGVLGMPADSMLDEITSAAKGLFGVPFAAVTLIDRDRQTMVSAIGMDASDVPRSEAFCDVTIRRPESLAVEDTLRDPRYAQYAAVKDDPGIRFYAGYPIESPDGQRIGALCVMDVKPRHFTKQDSALLRQLTQQVQARLWVLSGQGKPGTLSHIF